jgi:hypothetical protein
MNPPVQSPLFTCTQLNNYQETPLPHPQSARGPGADKTTPSMLNFKTKSNHSIKLLMLLTCCMIDTNQYQTAQELFQGAV